MRCPLCDIQAKTSHGLARHIEARHQLAREKARSLAAQNSQAANPQSNPKPLTFPTHSEAILANPYARYIVALLESLAANKRLPKYQFERRIDSILALFLPGILEQLWGWNVELIAPEFPLKKVDNNQSTNVDHLLFRRGGRNDEPPAWILFELKTDRGSVSGAQIARYRQALAQTMRQLIDDLAPIAAASIKGTRYAALRKRLAQHTKEIDSHSIELVYLSQEHVEDFGPNMHSMTFDQIQQLSLPMHGEVWELMKMILLPNLEVE